MDNLVKQNLVSICIPTYNGSEFIAQAMESAIGQTYKNLEIIVSDDASRDDTIAIINSFRPKTNISIKIYEHTPAGIGANWNNCVKQANGTYIKFLFQDDVLYPNCIERLLSVAKEGGNVGLVYCRRHILYDTSKPYDRNWVKNFNILHNTWNMLNVKEGVLPGKSYLKDSRLLAHPINKIGEPTAVLLHKSCFEKVGYFNTELLQTLDLEYWYRLMPYFNVGFVDEELVKFRLHDMQTSQVNDKIEDLDNRLLLRLQFKYLFKYLHAKTKRILLQRLLYVPEILRVFKRNNNKN